MKNFFRKKYSDLKYKDSKNLFNVQNYPKSIDRCRYAIKFSKFINNETKFSLKIVISRFTI